MSNEIHCSFISTAEVKGYRPAAKVHFNPVIKDNSTSEMSDFNLMRPALQCNASVRLF